MNISWDDILDLYFKHKELRLQTKKNYRRYVNHFSRSFGDEFTNVNQIDHNLVLSWRYNILHNRNCSNITWNSYVRHLRALFNFAIKFELIKKKIHLMEPSSDKIIN